MIAYTKPLPEPDAATLPFWEACQRHELRAQRCSACGRFRFPPQGVCPSCYSWDYEWANLHETGRVVTFVVVHYVSIPAFAPDVPYAIATVAIDGTEDQVHLTSNLDGVPWEDVRIGIPVRVVFDDVTSEYTLPKFRPA